MEEDADLVIDSRCGTLRAAPVGLKFHGMFLRFSPVYTLRNVVSSALIAPPTAAADYCILVFRSGEGASNRGELKWNPSVLAVVRVVDSRRLFGFQGQEGEGKEEFTAPRCYGHSVYLESSLSW